MNRSKIIALAGSKGSGKDSVAAIIDSICTSKYPGLRVRKVAFADPIKYVIQHIFDLNRESEEQYDHFKRTAVSYQIPKHLTHSISGRRVVREIGMLMRSYDEQQFVRYVLEQIESSPDDLWVITDLRFENELNAMIQNGAKIVNIYRPGFYSDGHITEQGIDDRRVDFIIENNGSYTDLFAKTEQVAREIFKEWNL